jgi:hypothetical protein
LISRHGIKLDPTDIQKRVLDGEGRLDLVQVLCMLLVPELLARAGDDDDSLIGRVHQVIMNDAQGGPTAELALTKDGLRDIMELYGEFDIPEDCLQEMVQSLDSTTFTADAFKRALTDDVQHHYSLQWKNKLSTHYDDVRLSTPGHELLNDNQGNVGLIRSSVVLLESKLLMENLKNGTVKMFTTKANLENTTARDDPESSTTVMTLPDRIFTAPSIDQVADTYRSLVFSNLLWLGFVITYFAYLWQIDSGAGRFQCGDLDDFGCRVGNGITRWMLIFAQLSIVGTAFILTASLGNDTVTNNRCHSIGYTLVGTVMIVLFTIPAYAWSFDAYVIKTEKKDSFKFVYLASLLSGIM